MMRSWGFRINSSKPRLSPTKRLKYLGIDVDLEARCLTVPDSLRDRVLTAVSSAPNRTFWYAQRLAGYLNFLRPVARLPLQIVRDVLARDTRLPEWVEMGLYHHQWEFTADDYHARFRVHQNWIASDATPFQIGLADSSGVLSIPLPGPVPIYLAELIGLMIATWPHSTVYGDNTAALTNAKKGRFPPSWAPLITMLYADRKNSYRYVPTGHNPADLPSRVWTGPGSLPQAGP